MVRYKPSQFTKKELEKMVTALGSAAGIDFLTGGALNKYTRKAAIQIAKTVGRLAIPAVSVSGRLAGQAALGTGRMLGSSAVGAAVPIVTNPYVAGAALGYGALQTQPGQELLEMAEDRGRADRIRFEQALTDLEYGTRRKVQRTKSKFNKAVSAGMKAAKQTTSYGKKGVINAPKKAFKAVTKMASKINKGRLPGHRLPVKPKGLNSKKIYNAILKVLK